MLSLVRGKSKDSNEYTASSASNAASAVSAAVAAAALASNAASETRVLAHYQLMHTLGKGASGKVSSNAFRCLFDPCPSKTLTEMLASGAAICCCDPRLL
jgi:serine/threonine protein kinase